MYGLTGRVVAAIAAVAGVISAIVAAAQASNIFSILPPRYAWIATVLPIVSLFIVGFSERIQGGASKPEVRAAAEASDDKNVARSSGNRPSDTLRCIAVPLLIGALALTQINCGSSGILRSFRAALEASPALVNSLVNSGVIKQDQADKAIADFKDGVDVALKLESDFKAIPKDDPDARAKKLAASLTAMRNWRIIIDRHNFAISVRLQQAANITDGILSSLVVFYSDDTGSGIQRAAAGRATVQGAASEKDLETKLRPQVDALKAAVTP